MRSLWLALLLALTSSSVLSADVRGRHAHPPTPTVEHADHLPAMELAHQAFGLDLSEKQVRTRDLNGRGQNARFLAPLRLGVTGDIYIGDLIPPDFPPSPAQAESLPYHATAPPLLV